MPSGHLHSIGHEQRWTWGDSDCPPLWCRGENQAFISLISLANAVYEQIFATVGTVEEKKYLSMHFRIQADHIYMSQDKTTTKKILEHTGGQGVDMIFSDSHTDLVQEYWRCIASFGRFVEIGRSEVSNNEQIDTKTIFRNSVLICYDMETLSNEKPATVAR